MISFLDKLKGAVEEEEPKKKAKKAEAKKIKVEPKEEPAPKPAAKKEEAPEEGQLALDVFENGDNIVIQSTIGGVKAEDLDIDIEDDLVTIRGSRQKTAESEGKNYFYQECYWGSFSRQVILPEEVDGSKADAIIKDGVLTLTIPKTNRKKKKKVAVKQED
jgi:HSP20 family protein